MTTFKRTIVTLILIIATIAVRGQIGKFYGTNNQLSTALVNCVMQDQHGFIWIATNNGLNVYDGYVFHAYKNDGTEGCIRSSIVLYVEQAADGTLYAGTNDGLQYFDSDKFLDVTYEDGSRVGGYSKCLYRASDGKIYGGLSNTQGIVCIDSKGKAKLLYDNLEGVNGVVDIAFDGKDHIWAATEKDGLVEISAGKVKARYFTDNSSKKNYNCVEVDGDGGVYVGSISGGLFYKPKGGNFRLVGGTANIFINTLLYKDDYVLIGTNEQGVVKYIPATDNVEISTAYNPEINLHKAKITSMMYDREGNFWAAMLQKGVFMYNTKPSPFKYQGFRNGIKNSLDEACLAAVQFTHDGHIWASTDGGGLYELDSNGKRLKSFGKGDVPPVIMAIAEDEDNRLWLGSYVDGAGWIDRNTGEYHRLPCTVGNGHSVFSLVADHKGGLWIGTMGDGLKYVNLKTQQVKEYRAVDDNPKTLYNNYIYNVSLSPDGQRVYVSASQGFSCLDIRSQSWVNVFGANGMLTDKVVLDTKEDKNGRVWSCTSDGLYVINVKTKKEEKHITTNEMLADNSAAAVLFDEKGYVWVSTLQGLSRINPKDWSIDNFYVSDGLQGNEFCWRVACSNDGVRKAGNPQMMCFGGMYGISWFSPSLVKRVEDKIKVELINISVGDMSVTAGSKSGGYTITDKLTYDSDYFDLCNTDNSLNIALSTLTYSNTESIVFMYKINNEDWIRLPLGKNVISLSHLQPGKYKFQVRADVNGTLSDIREFTIHIHPAWYFSIWAKLFYFIVAVFLVVWYIKDERRRHRYQLSMQEHIHAKEMSEQKLQFFMNISHDIRTPMTLIISPLEQLMKCEHDAFQQKLLTTIRRNADRILGLINQMMDLRKIDKGQMVLRFKQINIIDFVNDMVTYFEQQAKVKNISLTFTHDEDNIPVWIDCKNFDKVLVNVLSNAFKFTSTGGKIDVKVTRDDKTCTIAVYDNGEKIPEGELDKIFQRFYQAPSSANDNQAGTGIGLDLARALVEQHHGTITARNNEDAGCTFFITIPLGNEHINPEDIEEVKEVKEVTEVTEVKAPADAVETGNDDNEEEQDAQECQEVEEDVASDIQGIHLPKAFLKRRATVVIAEDDDDIRDYLTKEFEETYNVISCPNGKLAFQVVQKYVPQLLITDVMMPEMDGIELCAKVKDNVNTYHVPVLMLTAKNRDEDRVAGLELGADAYIVKPFNLDVLKATMANLINTRTILRNKYNSENHERKITDVEVKSPDDQLLERTIAAINNHLSDDKLSVEMLTSEIGISRVHFYRKMKELTNQSPHEFIRNIRLKQAAQLLSEKNCNVKSVMYACGFNNPTSFSTMFKSVYGMSPRQYMKEHQESDV